MEELRKIHQAIIFQLALRPNIMLVTWQLQATAKTLEEIYQQCPWSMQIFGCDSSTPHNILFPPAGVACLWKFQGIFPQRGMRVHTKKCRFMYKRVREISRVFFVPPRVFPLSVRARPRTVLSTNTSSLVHIDCIDRVRAWPVCRATGNHGAYACDAAHMVF